MSLNFTTKYVLTNPPHSKILPKQHKTGCDLIPGNKDVSTPPLSNQALLRGSARSTVCALSFSRWALNETQSLDNGESRCAALSGTLSSPLGKLRN